MNGERFLLFHYLYLVIKTKHTRDIAIQRPIRFRFNGLKRVLDCVNVGMHEILIIVILTRFFCSLFVTLEVQWNREVEISWECDTLDYKGEEKSTCRHIIPFKDCIRFFRAFGLRKHGIRHEIRSLIDLCRLDFPCVVERAPGRIIEGPSWTSHMDVNERALVNINNYEWKTTCWYPFKRSLARNEHEKGSLY